MAQQTMANKTLTSDLPPNWTMFINKKSKDDTFEGFYRNKKDEWCVCYRANNEKYFCINTTTVNEDGSDLKKKASVYRSKNSMNDKPDYLIVPQVGFR